jgi:hypothetical protein
MARGIEELDDQAIEAFRSMAAKASGDIDAFRSAGEGRRLRRRKRLKVLRGEACDNEAFRVPLEAGAGVALAGAAIQMAILRVGLGDDFAGGLGGWFALTLAGAAKTAFLAGALALMGLLDGERPAGTVLAAAGLAVWAPEMGFWFPWASWAWGSLGESMALLWLIVACLAIYRGLLDLGDNLLAILLIAGQIGLAFLTAGPLRVWANALGTLLGNLAG